ncbi:MAG TPA: cobyrinate a,c-diamide synthase [Pseudonocardiaceae bacterium]|nr:cobyrinate a,c-diamide synthase [Pseudonocardiaceae bacterium]
MVTTPRVVIAAPASGSGKTTVATGLIAALVARGRRVAPFKVGPDYIDPGYHALAAGRPGRNLDPVLVGEDRIAPLFGHGAADADVAVIEGVMGLFDGRSDTAGFGSTAHVARLLDAPVVLVVDGRGQGRSLAALLHGFRGYEPTVRLAAVLLNQVGSPRHEQVLREACAEIGLPVVGAVPRGADVALPSRHLGLVPAVEYGEPARRAVTAMAELITRSVDLDAISRLAATAGPLTATAWDPAVEVDKIDVSPVVAVAGGSAFTFGYVEHVELLAAAGAQVAVFDPLRDEALPDAAAALVLPGGFPEQHAAALSANTKLRDAVAEFARSGGLIQAECGGLLYLLDRLSGEPMCGVLPGTAELTGPLVLGYRDAVAAVDSAVHRTGERRTGHEFHRTHVIDTVSDAAWHWRDHDGHPVREGFADHHVHASYLHTHPAGYPETVTRLVRAAARP